MRLEPWLAVLLLSLGGCYVEQPPAPAYGYAAPGYPPPGSPPAGYPPPAYPQPSYDPYAAPYPGYSYNGGAPTILDGGIAVPLIVFGGEWGYYDRERHWHRAPEGVARDLEARRAGGGQFHQRPGQQGGQASFRPAEQPRPGTGPYTASHPAQAEQQRHEDRRECPSGQRC